MYATTEPEETYGAPDVAAAAGISYRRLDHWTRLGVVTASIRDSSGSGNPRAYHYVDVVEAALVARLVEFGVPLDVCRDAVAAVDLELERWHRRDDRAVLVVPPPSSGARPHVAARGEPVDRDAYLVVDVDALLDRVDHALDSLAEPALAHVG